MKWFTERLDQSPYLVAESSSGHQGMTRHLSSPKVHCSVHWTLGSYTSPHLHIYIFKTHLTLSCRLLPAQLSHQCIVQIHKISFAFNETVLPFCK
jgi:hypothetical protein